VSSSVIYILYYILAYVQHNREFPLENYKELLFCQFFSVVVELGFLYCGRNKAEGFSEWGVE
jgi:hypothetical protein